ncbi:hydantoinase B/oxoprolinase family protein [Microvirga flavescens]|uniref:hydantoinase B/oxoprolinase family protein n=1 Tax=Microvirga flavescens TaxID=2249811 RepID=UPI000DD649DC|nr:hydantoinase B/oxoprolinase family protein [Microvirga flavescens]
MSDTLQNPVPDVADARLNPITVEVIGSAFASIVEEMGEALVRASYSTNIKERRDCSTALFDADGLMLCQAEHIPMHLGSFIDFVPYVLRHFGLENIAPGDIFMGNDAYEGGGTHLPDIVIAEPIFAKGRLIAWAINTAHHSDFADRGHAHIYQEGLRIPPVRLFRAGVLQEDVQRLFLLNCQVPAERISDLRAQIAANRLGVARMSELCAKYGVPTVLAAGKELMDYAERKMRAGIAAIPDGTYRFADIFDSESLDKPLEMSVSITVSGDEIHLDFVSPPQVRAGLNVVYTALLATVYYAVKTVVDPTILPNAGLARPIHVTAEEGTILRCSHPAAVDGRITACQRAVDLIHGAFAQVVPERVTAASNGSVAVASFNGRRPDKSLWVYLETIGGGSGARHSKDGLDGVHVHMTNTSNLPVEALEGEYPITLLRYELVDGSGGAGTWVGGLGLRRVYRAEAECRVQVMGSRLTSRPWGLAGGEAGAPGYFTVNGRENVFDTGSVDLNPGDVLEIVTPGAGGYGLPSRRGAEDVARDLREGRLSAPAVAA